MGPLKLRPRRAATGSSFAEVLSLPGVEEQVELRNRFGFMAFHGGNLERRTEHIAERAAAEAGASVYAVTQPDGIRRHFPSVTVDPRRSSLLRSFIEHCDVVIAVHGYGRRGRWDDLLCGGQNRELAQHTGRHLAAVLPARYNVVVDLGRIPDGLRGVHPDNPVNLPSGKGVQLELPPGVRGLTPLAGRLGEPFPHLEALIAGLVAAARSWPVRGPMS